METFRFKGKRYEVDSNGFLVDHQKWDGGFAEGMAHHCGIQRPLTKEHWAVISFIRDTCVNTGRCPTIFETCRMNHLDRRELKDLFPSGYLRGACRLAGVTYRESHLGSNYMNHDAKALHAMAVTKVYHTNVMGFLVDAGQWDERWAENKAFEMMKIPGGKLNDSQWRLIRYLRQSHDEKQKVPTIYEVCEDTGIELNVLESLFPDGYHRGLVKIAGLRV